MTASLSWRWLAGAAILVATLALYGFMVAVTIPRLVALSGGLPIFDMRPTGYSFADATAFLAALTPEGKRYYLDVQHLCDTAFPVLNGLSVAILLQRMLPRRGVFASPYAPFAVNALALAVAGFDLMENAAVRFLLVSAPSEVTPEAVAHASGLTVTKSIVVTIAYLAILAAALPALMRAYRRSRS